MSRVADLPASAKRLFRGPTSDSVSGINTPGLSIQFAETWQVPQADVTAFFNVVFGSVEVVGGPSGSMLRIVPLRHPEYDNLIATGWSSTRVGWNSTLRFWARRNITVQFKLPDYALSGANAFLSRRGQPSTRSIPGVASGFLLNGIAPSFDPGEEIDGEEFSVDTSQIPTYDPAVYNAVRNCCNADAFLGYPARTVRYNGPTYDQKNTIAGVESWSMSHSFSYSKVPWNDYYVGGVLYPLTRADGSLKYTEVDLNAVFD